jgi:hypothetical protein
MSQENKVNQNVQNQTNRSSHPGRNFCIASAIIVFLGFLAIVIWFVYVNFLNNPSANSGKTNNSKSSNTSGNWTLTMTSPFSTTGPETSLTGEGKTTINFTMPSSEGQKFTASGPWNSELHGSVGPSTETTTITGKITLNGEIKNGKLTFLPEFKETSCRNEIVTPIGSQVTTNCDPNSIPDQKTITIETTNNATAYADIATNFGLYSYNWKENWKLTKTN